MNPTPTEQPPVKTSSLATPPQLIGFHIGHPVTGILMGDFIPMDKPFCAWLVARVLTLQLKQDLLLESDHATIFGTLGDGVCVFQTRGAGQAVAIIRCELEKLNLLLLCQIGIMEPTGWRCVWPGPEVNMTPLMDLKRMADITARHAEADRARLVKLCKLLNCPLPPIRPAASA